ncbi:MAG TPA: hypothetical protein VIB78_09595 [Acidimicrobiia bacterium]
MTTLGLLIALIACGAQSQPTTTGGQGEASTIESITVAEIEVENPDWMVASEDKVWILSEPEFEDDASVFALKAIDVQSNEVALTVNRRNSGCHGLAATADKVWVCDLDKVLEIDSHSGEVLGEINFDMSWPQGPIPIDDRGLWMLTREGTALVHVDFAGSELGRVELPGSCEQVALSEGSVFVSCPESRSASVIDREGYSITTQVDDVEVGIMSGGPDRVWMGLPHDEGGVGWITADGQVGTVPGSPDVSLGCLLVEDDDVWVRGSDIHLVRINAATGRVAESYQSERRIGGGCVTRAGGALWIGSLPMSKVWRLEAPD